MSKTERTLTLSDLVCLKEGWIEMGHVTDKIKMKVVNIETIDPNIQMYQLKEM